jgi:queuine tRNA-ribosyltransferase
MNKLSTNHGEINLPVFMPVATRGSVRNVSPEELEEVGAEIILSNTYHLIERPGVEIIKKAGGLHKFMNWNGPILTDSGGYQVFSLSKFRKIFEDGVEFRSQYDGSKVVLTPESVIKAQKDLGVDIAMVLDVNTKYGCSWEEASEAVRLTTKWAGMARKVKMNPGQKMFGIIQGSVFRDLREKSVKELLELDFDGYAIGGECQADGEKKLNEVLDWVVPMLPKDKPVYLMGIGNPKDIKDAVKRGVNMFDCVMPTREARHGRIYLSEKKRINITNAKFKKDFRPLSKKCGCYTCKNFSRAYVHHLFRVKEGLGLRLASLHNLFFLLDFVKQFRKKG